MTRFAKAHHEGYCPRTAVKSGLDISSGTFNPRIIKNMIPNGTPNKFITSSDITAGRKFQFEINGSNIEIKYHTRSSYAASNFGPSSNSGRTATAQIKVDCKLLNQQVGFQRNPNNGTHIPIKF